MSDTLRYYLPPDALLFLGSVALVPCMIVLWMGKLFGQNGVLVTPLAIFAVAAGMWTLPTTGAHGLPYTSVLPLPLIIGAVLGLFIWYALGRAQKR